MNKLIFNNIILSKNISYLIIYLLIFTFSLVFSNNSIDIIKTTIERNAFISFILIPSTLLLSINILDTIFNNLILMERFKDKKELTNYLIKTLIISIILINIITLLFMFIFIIILKEKSISFNYLLIINFFLNSFIIGLFVIVLRMYFNKYIVIFIMILLSCFIYGFDLDLSTTINNLNIFIIKIIIICFEYIFITIKLKNNMFNEFIRFDVVEILIKSGKFNVNHIKQII